MYEPNDVARKNAATLSALNQKWSDVYVFSEKTAILAGAELSRSFLTEPAFSG